MTFERKDKLVRWAYLPERVMHDTYNTQTNLCSLFWRTTFLVPIFVVVFGILAAVTVWLWLPIVLVVKVKPIGDFYDRMLTKVSEKRKHSVVWAYLKSLKNKTCVIVNIID